MNQLYLDRPAASILEEQLKRLLKQNYDLKIASV